MGKRLGEVGLHALGWALTLAVMWAAFDLGRMDWRYPIALHSWGDGTYYGFQVKVMLETGWVYRHPDLAAPAGLCLYDFAHFDAGHLLVMKLIGYAVPHWAGVLNGYYVLTYLLTATTALALFRHLKMSPALSLALMLVFNFQPHHFERGQGHLMLAAYWYLPLLTLSAVWLLEPLGLRDAEGIALWRSHRFRLACLFAFAAAFGGHYYTCFACLFYVTAAAYSVATYRRVAPLLQAAALVAVAAAGFGLNLVPNALHWRSEGPNRAVSAKEAAGSEVTALRLTQTLLPGKDHRLEPFRQARAHYDANTPLEAGGFGTPIGLLAGGGLLLLLGPVGLAVPRLRGLAAVALVATLVATLSGFGAIVCYLISPQIHSWERMSICLALFGLIAVGLTVGPWIDAAGRWRPLATAGVVVVGALALLDVLPRRAPYAPEEMKAQYAEAERFAGLVQGRMPPGSAVYTLPASTFPFGSYETLCPYLFTTGLRWSEPAMPNRPWAERQSRIERLSADGFLEELALLGFDGLIVSTKPGEPPLCAAAAAWLGRPDAAGQGVAFYDLRPHNARRRALCSAAEWAEKGRIAAGLSVVWGPQFGCEQRPRPYDATLPSVRWCRQDEGRIDVTNATGSPLVVDLEMKLATDCARGFTVEVPFSTKGAYETPRGAELAGRFVVPPGTHQVTMRCRERLPTPAARGLVFRVEGFLCRPVGPAAAAAAKGG